MRIPLDIICVKSGILCPRCKALVESGEHSEIEVDVMRVLLELENNSSFRFLRNANYIKSYKADSILVVVLDFQEPIPRSDIIRLGKILEDKLGLRVRIVQKTVDPKAFISQLISPARVQGIDIVWTPDGSVQHIVRIPRSDVKLLPMKVEIIESLLKAIYNEPYRVKIGY